ncbi:flagellar biosynthetic protein FliO [Thermodesulfobacterium hydrogeniphilum]|uniref:flagellar biosynthetic protein FliO n=1 Tax=Thermodesulfobacterium hydrogeniphilum TaxID=161156 RepID=UPI00056FC8F6|nr:flagellar biosynthetic protein FliO [Thermodesulfobacterium hydrogeniphilum]
MDWFYYLQSLGVVLLILSLFPIGLHFYKKYSVKSSSSNYIKILEIKPINYKAQLLLIEVEGKKCLIGYSDKGFSYLGEIKDDRP